MSVASPKGALIRGAAWTIGQRYAVKALGLVNTVIMARLLVPADYGVVAMAMLVVGLVQAFLDLGAEIALLRKNEVTRDEVDSAWTLSVIQGLVIGLAIVLASYPASLYFKEDRVAPMLWVLGGCVAIAGLHNVGLVLAMKEMNFRLEFKVQVTAKLLSVLATIGCGLWLRDYRALLIGIAISYLAGTVLSYAMHPYRPRWNTVQMGSIWATTKWLMLGNMGGYLLGKTDELIAARLGTTAQYGTYNVGVDLGTLPVNSIGPAIVQTFLPALAKLENEAERARNAITKTIGALNTVTLPLSLGFASIAGPATLLLLGAKWVDTVVFIAIFAVAGGIRFLLNPLGAVLVAAGHARYTMRVVWIEFVGFIVLALLLVPTWSLVGLALARMVAIALNTGLIAAAAHRHCNVDLRGIGAALARPLLGALLMAALMWFVAHGPTLPVLQVLCAVGAGASFFIAWSFATWHLVGRPEGLESTLFEHWQSRRAA